jgi:TP901 family phage tail tape measure protein
VTFRNIQVALSADVSNYRLQMAQASKATQEFGAATRRQAQEAQSAATITKQQAAAAARATNDLARETAAAYKKAQHEAQMAMRETVQTAAVMGAGIAAGIGFAVVAAKNFNAEMSNVKAVSNATAQEFGQLRTAALEAGQATKYSATDAARAEQELAKAGVAVQDIVGGGLRGALNLAAAGQLDLAKSAEIAASAMTVFGLRGQDVGHIADVLAAAANKAQGGVGDMGLALQQSSLVAHQFGLSIEDTVGTLALFAKNGLTGSDAGTSFKTMLQRLVPSSNEAAEKMDALGIKMFDATGKFIGIQAAAQELQEGLSGLSDEQRISALNTIFGADAIRASTILYEAGAKGVDFWRNSVNESGAAARIAAKNMDNLAGDLEQLRGAFETALIKTGDQATGVLRGLTQGATDAVQAYSALPSPVQGAVLAFGGLAVAGTLAFAAAATLIPKYVALREALETLGTTGARLSTGLGYISKGLAVATPLVALAAIGYSQYAAEKQKAADVTKRLVEALGQEASGIVGASDSGLIHELALKKQLDAVSKLGIQQFDLNQAIRGHADAQQRVAASILQSLPGLNQSAEGHDLLARAIGGDEEAASKFMATNKGFNESHGATARQLSGLLGTVDELNGRYQQATIEHQRLVDAADEVVASSGLEGDAASKLKSDILGAAGATAELTESQKALQSALSAAADPISAYKDVLSKKQDAERSAYDAARAAAQERASSARATAQQQLSDQRDVLQSRQADEREDLARRRAALGDHAKAERENLQNYGVELQTKQRKEREAFDAQHKAYEGGKADVADFVSHATVSLAEYAAELEKRNNDIKHWRANLIKVAARVGPDVAAELTKLGVESAPLVAQFANGTEKEAKRAAEALRNNMAVAADGVAVDLELAFKIAAIKGRDGATATGEAIAGALGAKTQDVLRIAQQYGIAISSAADPILQALGQPTIGGQIQALANSASGSALLSDRYADGGFLPSQATIAAGQGRGLIQWAEGETGGEAFIPLADSKRGRSMSILSTVAEMFGHVVMPKFADGGIWGLLQKIKPPPNVGPGAIADIGEGSMAKQYEALLRLAGSSELGGSNTPAGIDQIGQGWKVITDYLDAHQVPYNVTSTTGGKHAAGSYHYKGKAVDLVGDKHKIFAALLGAQPSLAELFYTPEGFSIKNSQRVPPIAASQHYDHVHAATYDSGGALQPGWTMAYNGTGRPEQIYAPGQLEAALERVFDRAGGSKTHIDKIEITPSDGSTAEEQARALAWNLR